MVGEMVFLQLCSSALSALSRAAPSRHTLPSATYAPPAANQSAQDKALGNAPATLLFITSTTDAACKTYLYQGEAKDKADFNLPFDGDEPKFGWVALVHIDLALKPTHAHVGTIFELRRMRPMMSKTTLFSSILSAGPTRTTPLENTARRACQWSLH